MFLLVIDDIQTHAYTQRTLKILHERQLVFSENGGNEICENVMTLYTTRQIRQHIVVLRF